MNRTHSTVLCVLFISSFILTGCSQKIMVDEQAEAKMDAPLRVTLIEATKEAPEAVIQCLIQLSSSLDDDKRTLLSDTGITILAEVNEIVTAEGSPEALRKAALLEIVQSMSLSQTR